jgi:hypothetical protein
VVPLAAVRLLVREALETVRGLATLNCETPVDKRVIEREKRVDDSEGALGLETAILRCRQASEHTRDRDLTL